MNDDRHLNAPEADPLADALAHAEALADALEIALGELDPDYPDDPRPEYPTQWAALMRYRAWELERQGQTRLDLAIAALDARADYGPALARRRAAALWNALEALDERDLHNLTDSEISLFRMVAETLRNHAQAIWDLRMCQDSMTARTRHAPESR